MLEDIFINWVISDDHFISLFKKGLEDRGFQDLFFVFSTEEVNVVLSGLGTADVVI